MPSDPTETVGAVTNSEDETIATPTRRCWRCLQQFPCPPEDVATGPGEWWLCEQCHGTLLPS